MSFFSRVNNAPAVTAKILAGVEGAVKYAKACTFTQLHA